MATGRALEAIHSMTKLCQITSHFRLRRRIIRQISILRRHLRMLWSRLLACAIGKSIHYRPLPRPTTMSSSSSSSSPGGAVKCGCASEDTTPSTCCHHHKESSDLVALKISVLGDCQIGKTSFLTKYVGREREQEGLQNTGLNQMDKTLCVKGAHIAYSIWEVEGDENTQNNVPIACKDSVAMLFMFDLTSRCTLNSVINWYQEARKWNQTAIPILIGTKFDDFVQLPIDLQWTIASQARAYARALNATLFFSSATYNINVNKIFKFITAKLFNLPWTLERNLTIGEPIIDF